MTIPGTTTWSSDPAEQQAIAAVQAMLAAQSEMLFAVDEARPLDPAGFDPAT
ncbi:hypothetical protein EV191_1372 [Tamaricihabitans halophyticus]|uniref:Uncharacterized protein n=1 Tax=Tamaricihabitans halophyticus TaxID=1262583 RepID=A0A4R2PSG7_9PSEU|nr:hypothetical protein [Tamaricihabitans halophyticus]TCP38820.1 hypothetical protein EV191_1372 [Tamaricihabitans halophyticus]